MFSGSPKNPAQSKFRHSNLLAVSLLTIAIPATAQTAGTYAVTNLVSDGSVPATITDANFINPWGITNATFWINAQGTGFNYVISPTNFPPFTPPATPAIAFKISIPASCRRHYGDGLAHRSRLDRRRHRLCPPQRHEGDLPLCVSRRHYHRLEQQTRHGGRRCASRYQ